MKEDIKKIIWEVCKMAEIYLNGAELIETDKLSLNDFVEKIESTPDMEMIDTIAYTESDVEDYKHFTTWITINGVPCVCGITTYNDGKCEFYLTYANYKTLEKVNMTYVGEAGYAASILILRARLWASKNKDVFKVQKFPTQKNDKWFAGQEKTII